MQQLDDARESHASRERQIDLAIADECRLNVLWWHGLVGRDRALELEVPGLSLRPGLTALFGTVECRPSSALDRDGALDEFVPCTFDLVTLYGRCASPAALRGVQRLLTPSGALLIAAGNRWWKGGLRVRKTSAESVVAASYARTLRNAGFGEVCGYAVEPSLATPRNLVPLTGQRLGQFETMRAGEWGGDLRRTLVRRAGLSTLLHPALLFVARIPPSPAVDAS